MRPHERAATKKCKACKATKEIAEFSAGRAVCKTCRCGIEADRYRQPEFNARHAIHRAKYYAEHRDTILRQKSGYGKKVSERDKARRRERYATDPEFRAKTKRRRDRYYANNTHVFRARDARRRADLRRQTPPWADLDAIKRFYLEAQLLTKITGVQHEVDHIYPLKGRTGSGLHVETNLRVIPAVQNRRKFNKVEDIVQTA